MAKSISQNFRYDGTSPNFERDQYATKAEMAAVSKKKMPSMFLAYCLEDHKIYLYDKSNDLDPELGLWREFTTGGGEPVIQDIDVRYCASEDGSYIFEDMEHSTIGDTVSISADGQYVIFILPYEVEIFDENGLNNTYSFKKEEIEIGEEEAKEVFFVYTSNTHISCENFKYKFNK